MRKRTVDTPADAPIMVRARITGAEWQRVRITALTLNVSTTDWVAEAIRRHLNRTTSPEGGSR